MLSVIIPVYNAATTLERTLGSLRLIAGEHRKRVQIVCSDDGSTDESVNVVHRFVKELKGFDWVVLQEKNAGVSVARNRALCVASGDWILLLDADDELALDPIRFLRSVSEETTMLCFPIERRFGATGLRKRYAAPNFSASKIRDTLSRVVPLHICAAIFKRKLAIMPFSEELQYLEDWAYWWDNCKLFSRVEIAKSHDPLAIVHVHQNNRTSDFEATGAARSNLASRMLLDQSLSRKQANNLRLQHSIGLILQGESIGFRNSVRFPCSPDLWAKFITYWICGKRISKIHPYRRSTE